MSLSLLYFYVLLVSRKYIYFYRVNPKRACMTSSLIKQKKLCESFFTLKCFCFSSLRSLDMCNSNLGMFKNFFFKMRNNFLFGVSKGCQFCGPFYCVKNLEIVSNLDSHSSPLGSMEVNAKYLSLGHDKSSL